MRARRKNFVVFFLIFSALFGILFVYTKQSPKRFFYSYDLVTVRENKDQNVGTTAKHELKLGSLYLAQEVLTSKEPLSGILCVDHIADVKNVDLFMPDMGHGAAPPKIERTEVPYESKVDLVTHPEFGCLKITDIQMFMAGLWQVRVFFNDDKMEMFEVHVAE